MLNKEGKEQEMDTIKYHTWHEMPYGKVTKHKKHHIQESQEVSSFPAGHNKAAMNRQHSIAMTNMNINNKNDPQEKHRLGTVSKEIALILLEDLKLLQCVAPPLTNYKLIS